MKYITKLIGFSALWSVFFLTATAYALPEFVKLQKIASPDSATLELEIKNLKTSEGQIMIALFDSEDAYDSEQTYRDKIKPVDSDQVVIRFSDISAGEYAFKLYHDINGDGELNTDMFGLPKEPYYFSTNASDPFSAPEWNEAKFLLPSGLMKRTIELN